MRIALVSPGFHSYYRSIQVGLEQLGHTVFPVVYDGRESVSAKIFGKLGTDLPAKFGRYTSKRERHTATSRVAAELAEIRVDVLLVVKGDVLDPDLVASFGRAGTQTVLWLYDELRRTRHQIDDLRVYDKVASYSRSDVRKLFELHVEVKYVPLAFDETLAGTSGSPAQTPDLAFIGSRYGRREELLVAATRADLTVHAYGRDWSRRPIDRARSLTWYRPQIAASGDVDREQAAGIMSEAVSVLNVHGDQDGFTMRTFEACGVGGLQLIDRDDVAEVYEPDREILVFHDSTELIELVQRAKREPAWADEIRRAGRRRTLADHTFKVRCAELVAPC